MWGHLNKNRRVQLILFLIFHSLELSRNDKLRLALPFLMVLRSWKIDDIFFIKKLISYLDIKEQKTLITILSFAFISTLLLQE